MRLELIMSSASHLKTDFPWDKDAWEEVNMAPKHLHEMIRAMCEEQARSLGKTRIDMEVVNLLKGDHGSSRAGGDAASGSRRVSAGGGSAAGAGGASGGGRMAAGSGAVSAGVGSAGASAGDSGQAALGGGQLGSESDIFQDLYAQEGVDPLTAAFLKRSPPHITLPSVRVPAEQLQQSWLDALQNTLPSQRRRSLYVHVPFCRSRCTYCPFYLMAYREEAAAEYVELLLRDIELTVAQIPHFDADSGGEYQAIFFGGGTPSDLSAEQLGRLLRALRRHFPLSHDCEITVEGRVANFDADKARACRDAGATRISLGVQTFDTRVRQAVGRIADESEVCRTLEALGSIDGLALNIDLMYGLPGQGHKQWEHDLAQVNALGGIHGVDLYELKKIPGSPLARAQSLGRIAEGEDLAARAHMYAYGAQALESAGWERLSCCHWGRSGNRQNRYNVYAKSGAVCVPFGTCSGGRVGLLSVGGPQTVKDYQEALDRGQKPLFSARCLSEMAAVHDRIAGQLEFGRLDPEAVRPGLGGYLQPLLQQWQSCGLLERAGDTGWALTLAGRFWVKELSSRLARAVA